MSWKLARCTTDTSVEELKIEGKAKLVNLHLVVLSSIDVSEEISNICDSVFEQLSEADETEKATRSINIQDEGFDTNLIAYDVSNYRSGFVLRSLLTEWLEADPEGCYILYDSQSNCAYGLWYATLDLVLSFL